MTDTSRQYSIYGNILRGLDLTKLHYVNREAFSFNMVPALFTSGNVLFTDDQKMVSPIGLYIDPRQPFVKRVAYSEVDLSDPETLTSRIDNDNVLEFAERIILSAQSGESYGEALDAISGVEFMRISVDDLDASLKRPIPVTGLSFGNPVRLTRWDRQIKASDEMLCVPLGFIQTLEGPKALVMASTSNSHMSDPHFRLITEESFRDAEADPISFELKAECWGALERILGINHKSIGRSRFLGRCLDLHPAIMSARDGIVESMMIRSGLSPFIKDEVEEKVLAVQRHLAEPNMPLMG